MKVTSQLTGGETEYLFSADVLGKYPVAYHRCVETGFIQTDFPHWLAEAYSAPITALDIGLVSRNIHKAELTANVIDRIMPRSSRYLDFGGGYGMFTRIMRDRGYAFLHYDEYCENLFAKSFQVDDWSQLETSGVELLTAWEVFEHLPDPIGLVQKLFSTSDVVLFSTELVPARPLRDVSDWWYFAPETGQHVSFFTRQSLEYLAKRFAFYFYTDGHMNHLFSRNRLPLHPFLIPNPGLLRRVFRRLVGHSVSSANPRDGLLQHDFEQALAELRQRQSGQSRG